MKKHLKYTVETRPTAEVFDLSYRIVAESSMELGTMIRRLQRCGHNHNFLVEQDVAVREHSAIWVSLEGAQCATEGQIEVP